MSELDKLYEWLIKTGYDAKRVQKPYVPGVQLERNQVVVFKDGEWWWDAICHPGSYGYDNGLLEVMGDPVVSLEEDGDEVEGWLTADDVIKRFKERK